jgi:hypothetical protein
MRSVKMSGARGMPVNSWKHRAMTVLLAMLAGGSLLAGLAAGPPASAAAASPGPAPGVTMSAAARSASTVYLAYTATNRAVYVRNAAQPGQAAIALGGRLIGGPAAVVVPAGVLSPGAALAVFGRGTNNALWWRHQTASGWSNWQSLGGILTSAPGAAADMTDQFGRLNVFARGTNGVIWYRVFGAGKWGPWTSLGGAVMAGTGPGAGNGLFAIANPDRHVSVFGRVGTEYGYTDFGGLTTATPGITGTAPGQSPVEVFARGLNNALWYRTSMLPIAPTGPWTSLGGRLTSGVTATTVPGGKTYVFVLGTDNNIWMRMGTWPSLGGWTRL